MVCKGNTINENESKGNGIHSCAGCGRWLVTPFPENREGSRKSMLES